MKNLTNLAAQDNNDAINQQKLIKFWGNSLSQLTPRQRELVVEILSNINLRGAEA